MSRSLRCAFCDQDSRMVEALLLSSKRADVAICEPCARKLVEAFEAVARGEVDWIEGPLAVAAGGSEVMGSG